MFKNQTILEINKNENSYQFIFSPNSPAGEIFDILTEMRAFVLGKIQEASNSEMAQAENAPKEN